MRGMHERKASVWAAAQCFPHVRGSPLAGKQGSGAVIDILCCYANRRLSVFLAAPPNDVSMLEMDFTPVVSVLLRRQCGH